MGIGLLSQDNRLEIESGAAYVQDSWAVTRDLTLNLGLRWETYEHRNAAGNAYLDIDNAFAPRLGFVWDVSGSGRSKLYGSAGRYQIPYHHVGQQILRRGSVGFVRVYLLDGDVNPDGTPEGLGPYIIDWS